jgi:phosphonate ABC transporter permease subunit PhnE
VKEPRPLLRTVLYIVLIIAGILIYAYGWHVTDISLEEIQEESRQKQVTRALRELLSPVLFEWDTESELAHAEFFIPCTDTPTAPPDIVEGQPYLTLSPNCGAARDEISIEGFNFRRYSDGHVRWTPPGGSVRSLRGVRTDGKGHFGGTLRIPSATESSEAYIVEAEIQWPVGKPRASDALKSTANGMIETIFLALMATTMAILFAFPLSFIAAHNLMRQVRTPLGSLLAALLPLPVGWLAGRWALGPVVDFALRLGNDGWLGVPILAVVAVGLYLVVIKRILRLGRVENPWLAGVVRYVRLILGAALFVFVSGLLSGIGTLLEALLDRVDHPLIQRALGTILGAGAIGLLVFLVYSGISNFYRPGEPVPYLTTFVIGGAVLGGVLGFILRADYDLPIGLVTYYGTRTVLNILRSVEPLIMAIVFVIWVSIGPFAGVLALTLHSVAALGKLYSEQVESIDPGPLEAITATGATRLQTIIYGVVPQIVPPYIAFTLYRWDINVRMSTIIGFVGGGGIGLVLKQWIDLLQYRQACVAPLAIAIVVSVLDYISARTREKIV